MHSCLIVRACSCNSPLPSPSAVLRVGAHGFNIQSEVTVQAVGTLGCLASGSSGTRMHYVNISGTLLVVHVLQKHTFRVCMESRR
eukprot:scaffold1628_cov407-Prasinococcus_capsulatus_cf.AAC.10